MTLLSQDLIFVLSAQSRRLIYKGCWIDHIFSWIVSRPLPQTIEDCAKTPQLMISVCIQSLPMSEPHKETELYNLLTLITQCTVTWLSDHIPIWGSSASDWLALLAFPGGHSGTHWVIFEQRSICCTVVETIRIGAVTCSSSMPSSFSLGGLWPLSSWCTSMIALRNHKSCTCIKNGICIAGVQRNCGYLKGDLWL